jgi:thiol-disulfide isomerase/thioredoxin
MKWYSRSREDFIHVLYSKYYKMKEAIFIEGSDCAKCHMMKPHAQRYCEDNWYEFQTFRFDDASVSEFNVQTVPMLVLREDWVVTQILNEEGIVNLISNKQ